MSSSGSRQTSSTGESVRDTHNNIIQDLQQASKSDLNGYNTRYVPRGALTTILDNHSVRSCIKSLFGLDTEAGSEALDELAHYVSPADGESCHCQDSRCTGSRVIFASLLLIGKGGVIKWFAEQPNPKLCDRQLPFRDRMPDLTDIEKELFHYLQWQMRAPYIEKIGDREEYEEFDENLSLPWTELEDMKPIDGQISRVVKIAIDGNHHDLGNDRFFALKIFEKSRNAQESFESEIVANQRTPRDDRIVQLLAAFKHRKESYLVLPWADSGNLLEIWQNRSLSHDSGLSIQWLLNGCHSIAASVAAIHQPPPKEESREPGTVLIHTDIKPENILCFPTTSARNGPFMLKLADFGLAKLVDTEGIVEFYKVSHTKTYRPPEFDIEKYMTPKYDIWCLGCLYLEFVTWAILGRQGVEEFEEERSEEIDARFTEALGHLSEDTFFRKIPKGPTRFSGWRLKATSQLKVIDPRNTAFANATEVVAAKELLVGIKRTKYRVKCVVKHQVREHITRLQRAEGCTPKLARLLDYIRDKMLVTDPKLRVTSENVRDFLGSLTNNA